jgi:hypothetical protein
VKTSYCTTMEEVPDEEYLSRQCWKELETGDTILVSLDEWDEFVASRMNVEASHKTDGQAEYIPSKTSKSWRRRHRKKQDHQYNNPCYETPGAGSSNLPDKGANSPKSQYVPGMYQTTIETVRDKSWCERDPCLILPNSDDFPVLMHIDECPSYDQFKKMVEEQTKPRNPITRFIQGLPKFMKKMPTQHMSARKI